MLLDSSARGGSGPGVRMQVWYTIYFGSAAFVSPFINLFLFNQGYSARQIGTLAAARPWLGAIASNALCGAADTLSRHRCVMHNSVSAPSPFPCWSLDVEGSAAQAP